MAFLCCVRADDGVELRARVLRALRGEAPDPRGPGRLTLAAVAHDASSLRAELERAAEHLAAPAPAPLRERRPGLRFEPEPPGPAGVAWLFPGQGSQSVGMLAGLLAALPGLRERALARDEEVHALLGRSLLAFVDAASTPALEAELTQTHNAQAAIGFLSAVLAEHLREALGVSPGLLAGHSYGELAALQAAGAFELAELMRLSEARGRLLGAAAARAPGSMLAIRASAERAAALLEGLDPGLGPLVLANLNAPRQLVASGARAAIAALAARCDAERVVARPIKTACAFHSPLMAPVAAEWAAFLAERAPHLRAPTRGRVVSSVTAAPYPAEAGAVEATLARQVVAPVRWVEAVERLHAEGARLLVEVGPGRVLCGLVRDVLAGRPFEALPLDPLTADPAPAREHALGTLAALAAAGIPLVSEPFAPGEEVWRALATAAAAPALAAPALAAPAPDPPLVPGAERLAAAPTSPPAAPAGARAYFEGNRRAVEGFFTRQRTALEQASRLLEPAEQAELLARALATNLAVLDELFAAQEAGLQALDGAPASELPASEPAAEAARAEELDLEGYVRAELCRVTGFPAEAIRADSRFEDELGLDSITLSEVLFSVIERFPSLAAQADALRGVRTLAELLERCGGPAAASPAAPPPAPPSAATARPEPAAPPRAPAWQEVMTRIRRALIDDFELAPDELLPEADLERELGLDAFSRRALLAATLKDQPGLALGGRELLHARDLAGLEALLRALDPAGALEASAAPEPPRPPGPARYVLRCEPAPLPEGAEPARERVLVAGPPEAVDALAPALAAAGARPARLHLTSTQGWRLPDEPGEPAIDLVDAPELERRLRARLGALPDACLLLAWDEAAPAGLAAPSATWEAELERAATGAFTLARALAPHFTAPAGSAPRALVVVGREDRSPAWSAARGFARSLAREWPKARVRAVWLDAQAAAAELAPRLLRELAAPGERDVVLRGPARLRPVAAPAPLPEQPVRLREGATALLLGGGSGITAELAVGLARARRCTIVALGRTAPVTSDPYPDLPEGDPAALKRRLYAELQQAGLPTHPAAIQRRFQEVTRQRALLRTRARVEAAGGRLAYYVADVTSGAALEAALGVARAEHGPLHLVVHGAGLTADELLARKSLADLRRVVRTKASALHHLHRLVRDEPLEAVVLLSSIAAHTGVAGQTDYAAANAVLDAAAASWSAAAPYPVVALAYAAWSESGLAAGGAFQRLMERRGLSGITNEAGVRAFLSELGAPAPEPWALHTPPEVLRFAEGGEGGGAWSP